MLREPVGDCATIVGRQLERTHPQFLVP